MLGNMLLSGNGVRRLPVQICKVAVEPGLHPKMFRPEGHPSRPRKVLTAG